MASTYTPIATQTLSTTSSSVNFTSISGSYTDLIIVIVPKTTLDDTAARLRFNSDSGSNYSDTFIFGNGTTAGSGRHSNITYGRTHEYGDFTTNGDGVLIVQMNNYSNTTTYKNWLARSNRASKGVDALVGLWRSTSAITAIEIYPSQSTWAAGSTFTLYGVKSA